MTTAGAEGDKPPPGKKCICVWTLPVGTRPIVRVEVDGSYIRAQNLYEIGCNALGLNVKSRRFFALFRGTINPTKKYGTEENIYVPCKATLSIQRWSFDLKAEMAVIRTDAVAFRLIAMQIICEVENGKMKISNEEMKPLKEYHDAQFVCYKQMVEEARKLAVYNSVCIMDVEVMQDAKLITTTLEQGSKVNLVCSSRKMMMISDSVELSVPWRKIRQFAEIKETKTINLEIFLADEKAFSWVELQSAQGTLLLQVMVEFIDLIRNRVERPAFRQPNWVGNPKVNKLSWQMIKSEIFGIGRGKKEEKFETFDDIDCSSSSEDEGEEDGVRGSCSTLK